MKVIPVVTTDMKNVHDSNKDFYFESAEAGTIFSQFIGFAEGFINSNQTVPQI